MLKNKSYFIVFLLISSAFMGVQSGQAAIPAGPGELTISADLSTQYSSNVASNSGSDGDGSVDLGTNVGYSITRKYYTVGGGAGVNVGRFFEQTENDYEDFTFDFNITPTDLVGGRKFNIDTNLGFSRSTTSDGELGQFVTTDNYNAGATFSYLHSRKLTFTLSPNYSLSDPKSSGLSETENYSLSGGVSVVYTEKLNITFGGSWSRSESDDSSNVNSDVYSANFGATGEILPRLTGSVTAGASFREFTENGSGQTASPTVGLDLRWIVNSLSNATFSASRDFGSSALGSSTVSTTFGATLSRTINSKLSASSGVTVEIRELESPTTNRDDISTSLSFGLGYRLRENASLGFRVGYVNQQSDDSRFEFDRFTTSLNLGITY